MDRRSTPRNGMRESYHERARAAARFTFPDTDIPPNLVSKTQTILGIIERLEQSRKHTAARWIQYVYRKYRRAKYARLVALWTTYASDDGGPTNGGPVDHILDFIAPSQERPPRKMPPALNNCIFSP
jgi:hypothetical protein